MLKRVDRKGLRLQRHARTRKMMAGTAQRPRLSVFRSLKHMYAQIVDDTRGVTLAAVSTLDGELRSQAKGKRKAEASDLVGQMIAKQALERGIKQVVFDRGGYKYHGRVKALAEAARKAGLEF